MANALSFRAEWLRVQRRSQLNYRGHRLERSRHRDTHIRSLPLDPDGNPYDPAAVTATCEALEGVAEINTELNQTLGSLSGSSNAETDPEAALADSIAAVEAADGQFDDIVVAYDDAIKVAPPGIAETITEARNIASDVVLPLAKAVSESETNEEYELAITTLASEPSFLANAKKGLTVTQGLNTFTEPACNFQTAPNP